MTARLGRAVEVLVVGAGPAGLAVAERLARRGVQVEVLDREDQPGGVPRHCHHLGYGWRDLRVLSGPRYAQRLAARAQAAGARIRTAATATDWSAPLALEVTSPGGLERIEAGAVILATGARERPRSARLVPGSRPAGVYTTGELQQAVHLHRQPVGHQAVVIGAEHVSFSALLTLRRAGVQVSAMITDLPRHQSFPGADLAAGSRYSCPVLTRTAVTRLLGHPRLTGVEVRAPDGRTRVLEADTVVFTGDWIPDHELARLGGLALDPGTRGPVVDPALRTTRPGVFAAGNLVHPVRSADAAALAGRAVAGQVLAYLSGGHGGSPAGWPISGQVPVTVRPPLRWAMPSLVHPAAPPPPGRRLTLWAAEFVPRPVIEVRQDGRLLHRDRRLRTLVPNRPWSIDAGWCAAVHAGGGPVTVVIA